MRRQEQQRQRQPDAEQEADENDAVVHVVYYSTTDDNSADAFRFIKKHSLEQRFRGVCVDDERQRIPSYVQFVPCVVCGASRRVLVGDHLFQFLGTLVKVESSREINRRRYTDGFSHVDVVLNPVYPAQDASDERGYMFIGEDGLERCSARVDERPQKPGSEFLEQEYMRRAQDYASGQEQFDGAPYQQQQRFQNQQYPPPQQQQPAYHHRQQPQSQPQEYRQQRPQQQQRQPQLAAAYANRQQPAYEQQPAYANQQQPANHRQPQQMQMQMQLQMQQRPLQPQQVQMQQRPMQSQPQQMQAQIQQMQPQQRQMQPQPQGRRRM